MKLDWHGYAERLVVAERAIEKAAILEVNKQLIREFERDLVVHGISKPRIIKYLSTLLQIARARDKSFADWTREDVTALVEWVERRELSEWTKQSYKVVLKRFFKWLRKAEDEYPPEVRWIKTNIRKDRLSLPAEGDLLTHDEALQLIRVADHPRDKAFIAVLYESGGRIGEVATPCIRDVTFEKIGCRVIVNGKTGPRPILLVESAHYLATWLSMHPQRDNRESPLWVNIGNTKRGKPLQYGNVRKLLKTLFEKAGIKKRCNPHLFRHSSATEFAKVLTEFQMNQRYGWVQGSRMPGVYVHLSGKSTDEAVLRVHGITDPDASSEPARKARGCPRCEAINPSDFTFCGRCGTALDLKVALEAEERQKLVVEKREASDAVLNKLLQDDEVRELLRRKLVAVKD